MVVPPRPCFHLYEKEKVLLLTDRTEKAFSTRDLYKANQIITGIARLAFPIINLQMVVMSSCKIIVPPERFIHITAVSNSLLQGPGMAEYRRETSSLSSSLALRSGLIPAAKSISSE
jgi:hypothetical protein